jgi:hypothetical protein
MKLFHIKPWQTMLLLICLAMAMLTFMTGAAAPGKAANGGTGNYALELDGVVVGWLHSAEGGNATADVISEPAVPGQIQKKHLAGVKYEDIIITAGTGMSSSFYQWMKDSFEGKYSRKNGAIIAVDSQYREVSRIAFTNGLLKEITFPELNAAAKDPANITVTISPEWTRRTVSQGSKISLPNSSKGKQWLTSNFRFKLDGLEKTTASVNKIAAITVKWNRDGNAAGEVRDNQLKPVKIEFPNVVITLAESNSQPLYDWLDDFLISGNNGDGKEKSGTLEYLTPDLKESFFTLNFSHLGIFKLATEVAETNNVRRIEADMYCESISLTFNNSATRN